jgi:endonuclease/exonuclease/phosphatase family metal-dependent hydrolase
MRLKKTWNPLFLKSIVLLLVLPAFTAVFLNSSCLLKPKIEGSAADISGSGSSQITVLSQNTMLIPLDIAAPEYIIRTGLISEMLAEGEFDIVGLQEVFAGASQDSILKTWHHNVISGGEDLWQPITGAKEVSGLAASKNIFGIKILDARPNKKSAKISFGPYYVLGPDTESCNIFKQDSGLLILSRFPIIAAGAFSFSDAQGSDRLANKGVVYARIKTGPSNDDYIHFFNTHLQSHGYGETRFKNLSEFLMFVSTIVVDDLSGHDDYKGNTSNPNTREDIKDTQARGIHPIIMVGDFNIKAYMPDNWIKKSNIISAPQGQEMPDDSDNTLNTSADYDEFMNYLKSFTEAFIQGNSDELLSLYFEDLWKYFYPDDPGFTWIGKGWKTGEQNPYGTDGNPIAIENGPPERIDYVVYFKGSGTLQLNPSSIKLFPVDSSGLQVSDHLGLVSVFDRQN